MARAHRQQQQEVCADDAPFAADTHRDLRHPRSARGKEQGCRKEQGRECRREWRQVEMGNGGRRKAPQVGRTARQRKSSDDAWRGAALGGSTAGQQGGL